MIRAASGAAVLKLFNMTATLIGAVILARVLGAKEYGLYVYAMSWVTLLSVFANAGVDQVMIRNIAIFHQSGDWAHVRGMLRFGLILVSISALFCVIIMASVAVVLHGDAGEIREALLFSCCLIPLQALITPFSAAQQGLGQIIYAQLPGLFVTPLFFLVGVAAALGISGLTSKTMLADQVIAIRIAAIVFSVVTAIFLLRAGMTKAGKPPIAPPAAYQTRAWLISALPLVLMGSMFMVNANADILMLGSMVGAEAAGIYKTATRGAELLTYSSAIISAPLGPLIARLYAAGQTRRLQVEIQRWAWAAFAPAVVLATIFFVDGNLFLAMFGPEFTGQDASDVLCLLTIGQLIHVAVGPVGLLLLMTGHARYAAQSLAIGALLNIVFNAVLIPKWGIYGSAIATGASTVIFASLLLVFARRHLGLNPTVFSAPFRKV